MKKKPIMINGSKAVASAKDKNGNPVIIEAWYDMSDKLNPVFTIKNLPDNVDQIEVNYSLMTTEIEQETENT